MASDLCDEFDILYAINEDMLPPFQPIFDPTESKYKDTHLSIQQWRLSEDRLRDTAILASRIRRRI